MWDPQWTELPGFRLVRCDFRGFGESPVATEDYRDDDDVLALLDLGIRALPRRVRLPRRERRVAARTPPWAGHLPNLGRPAAITAPLTDFLN
ncbi:MAG TPA: hypothetical protein VH333_17685 [Pseudonocardiaceae bacterium]|jgi:hypothetical protein|nr:hypothetical protein [Pseudonocardiaceae bacterium]